MQAMTFMAPPHSPQVSMSILNTRFNLCAQVIDARRSAGVGGSSDTSTLFPLPRFTGDSCVQAEPSHFRYLGKAVIIFPGRDGL